MARSGAAEPGRRAGGASGLGRRSDGAACWRQYPPSGRARGRGSLPSRRGVARHV